MTHFDQSTQILHKYSLFVLKFQLKVFLQYLVPEKTIMSNIDLSTIGGMLVTCQAMD